ncbi:hypothetical protein [Nostoc sp. DedQUE03]|nr:hypothetical protein [Nostoc sp. DedQUE03]MDZ8046879.1 hypothetical protein [Nostoc sp. DedQUE02]
MAINIIIAATTQIYHLILVTPNIGDLSCGIHPYRDLAWRSIS